MPTFRRLVFFVFSAGAVCGLLGWLLAGAAPERWYARAVVQAGFSAQLNWESAQQLGQSMSPVAVAVEPVESPHEMLERVNMVSFRMDALHASQLADREDLADAMKHRFSARVLPAPKLLELRVRGADAEAPRQLLDALIAHLRAAHAKEIDPARRSIESLLAQRRAEEKALLRYVSELDPADLSRPEVLRNSFGSNAAFASLFVKGAQAQVARLRQEIIVLDSALDSVERRNTGPLGASVDVIDDGWAQRRGVVTAVAALLGAFFGALVAYSSRPRRPA